MDHISVDRLREVADIHQRPFTDEEFEHFRSCDDCVNELREILRERLRSPIR